MLDRIQLSPHLSCGRLVALQTKSHSLKDSSSTTSGAFSRARVEGESTLREVDPNTGAVIRSQLLGVSFFAEGLALVGDRVYQITFKDRTAFVHDADTFEQLETFEYDGVGWGLCFDGNRLIMSNGSDRLTFRDPESFEETGGVDVTMDGNVLQWLNELECVDGKEYANLFRSDLIAVIDPSKGAVETLIDASSLPRQAGADVLNGIAIDPDGRLWLTGKLLSQSLVRAPIRDVRQRSAGVDVGCRECSERAR